MILPDLDALLRAELDTLHRRLDECPADWGARTRLAQLLEQEAKLANAQQWMSRCQKHPLRNTTGSDYWYWSYTGHGSAVLPIEIFRELTGEAATDTGYAYYRSRGHAERALANALADSSKPV